MTSFLRGVEEHPESLLSSWNKNNWLQTDRLDKVKQMFGEDKYDMLGRYLPERQHSTYQPRSPNLCLRSPQATGNIRHDINLMFLSPDRASRRSGCPLDIWQPANIDK